MPYYFCFLFTTLLYFQSFAQTRSWHPLDFTQSEIRSNAHPVSDSVLNVAFLNTVKINDSCSGFRVSSEGLIVTNKRCISRYLQTANLPDTGFWASTKSEELGLLGFKVGFQVDQKDITSIILNGINPSMSAAVKQQTIENNKLQYLLQYPKPANIQLDIIATKENSQFYLQQSFVIRDVKLVGHTGNALEHNYQHQWPRPSLDFAFLRVYPSKEIEKELLSTPLKMATEAPRSPTPLFATGFPVFSDLIHTSQSFQLLVVDDIEERMLIDSLLLQKLQRLGANQENFAKIRTRFNHRKAQLKSLLQYKGADIILERENQSLLKQEDTEQAIFLRKKLDQAALRWRKQSKIRNYAQVPYAELPLMRKVEILASFIRPRNPNPPVGQKYDQGKLTAALNYISKINETKSLFDEQALFTAASEVFFSQAKADRLPSDIKDLISVFQKDYQALGKAIYSESILIDQNRLDELAKKDPTTAFQQIQDDIAFRFFRGILRVNRNQVQLPYRKAETAYTQAKQAYFNSMSSAPSEDILTDADGSLRVSQGDFLMDQGFTFLPPNAFGKNWSENLQLVPNTFQNNLHLMTGSSGSPVFDQSGQVVGVHLDRMEESIASDWVFQNDRQNNTAISTAFIQSYLSTFPKGRILLEEINKK